MSGIFLNYRREDSAPYAGRLHDMLTRAFPGRAIFMDIEGIQAGEDFVAATDRTILASQIVIAVIGPEWTSLKSSKGVRRLDNPEDFVVRELSAALMSGVRIIPVLVGGATMPTAADLPKALEPLTRRHAIELSDTRFASDANLLIDAIARALDAERQDGVARQGPKKRSFWAAWPPRAIWAGLGALGIVLVAVFWSTSQDGGEDAPVVGSYLSPASAWEWLSIGHAYCYDLQADSSCMQVEFPMSIGKDEIVISQLQLSEDGGTKLLQVQKLRKHADGRICTTHSAAYIDSLQMFHAGDRRPRIGSADEPFDVAQANDFRAEWKRMDQELLNAETCIRFLVSRIGREYADFEMEEHHFRDGIRQPGDTPSKIVLVDAKQAKEQLNLRPAAQ